MSVVVDEWLEADSAPWVKVNEATEALAEYAAGSPLHSISADYTLVATDAGKTIYHPASDTTPRTLTIPSNASVPFPNGTLIPIVNEAGAGDLTISITSDTLVLVGAAGSTGSLTLASGGEAVLRKVLSTRWRCGGTVELTP